MTVGDGSYADLQCWRLEGGDQDFALETGRVRDAGAVLERGKRGGCSLAGWGIDEWDHRSRLAAEMSECGRERLNGKCRS